MPVGSAISSEREPAKLAAAAAREHGGQAVTVIAPAFNEAESVAETVESLLSQPLPTTEIIVVDHCSDDDTGPIAASLGVTVVRPPANTGSKAGAQTFALDHVKTGLVMAVDADTSLAPDGLEKLLAAMDDPGIAAASGFVLPGVCTRSGSAGATSSTCSHSASSSRSRTTTRSR